MGLSSFVDDGPFVRSELISGDLSKLKSAITGNPALKDSGTRTDFGFIGTMGNPPARLAQLWRKDSQPDFVFDPIQRIGAGWLGPYVTDEVTSRLAIFDTDRSGRAYIYTTKPFVRDSDSETVAIRIRAVGPDGISGTADDQIEDILQQEIYATVSGRLLAGGRPMASTAVALNVPAEGAMVQRRASTNAAGMFAFKDVPFGRRSLSINPSLTYEPDSAKKISGGIEFTVTNYGTQDAIITSVRATYETYEGTAYYGRIQIGKTIVFDSSDEVRAQSGQVIHLSNPVRVRGSRNVISIAVQEPSVRIPMLQVTAGQSIRVEFLGLYDRERGPGNDASQSLDSATFTFWLGDGSASTLYVRGL